MQTVIVDEALTTKLEKANAPIEIVTRDGRRLGFFTPGPPMKYDLDPKVSEEELQRRLNDPNGKWYTADEVAAKMKEWRCSQ